MKFWKWFGKNRKALIDLYDDCRAESEILMGFSQFSKEIYKQTDISDAHKRKSGANGSSEIEKRGTDRPD